MIIVAEIVPDHTIPSPEVDLIWFRGEYEWYLLLTHSWESGNFRHSQIPLHKDAKGNLQGLEISCETYQIAQQLLTKR